MFANTSNIVGHDRPAVRGFAMPDDDFVLWREPSEQPPTTNLARIAPVNGSYGHSSNSASATTTATRSQNRSGEGSDSNNQRSDSGNGNSSSSDDANPQVEGRCEDQPPANGAAAGAEVDASMSIIAERFKTKLCKKFEQTGHCPYTGKCMFAHGSRELRTMEQNMADGVTNQGAVYALRRRMAKDAKLHRNDPNAAQQQDTPDVVTQLQPSAAGSQQPQQTAGSPQAQSLVQQPLLPPPGFVPAPTGFQMQPPVGYPGYHGGMLPPQMGVMPGYGGYMPPPPPPPLAHPGFMPMPALPYAWPTSMPPPMPPGSAAHGAPLPMAPNM